MYSWRIHLVLFIVVHPTQHKGLYPLSSYCKNIYQFYNISVSLLIIQVNCWRSVNVRVIISVYDLATQTSFPMYMYPVGV